MAIAAGILIAVYMLAMAAVVLWPWRRRSPEDGQAIGCIMLAIVALALTGGVLALAAWRDWTWLVRALFYAVVVPAVIGVPQLIRELWMDRRRRRARTRAVVSEATAPSDAPGEPGG
jgi:hypothetical protein